MDDLDEFAFSGFTACHNHLNGKYIETGEKNHGKPVYIRKAKSSEEDDQYLYFWDVRDGNACMGWWLGVAVGSDKVWARSQLGGTSSEYPPPGGWCCPHDSPECKELRCRVQFRVSIPSNLLTDFDVIDKSLRAAEKIVEEIKVNAVLSKKHIDPMSIKPWSDLIHGKFSALEEPLLKARKMQADRQTTCDKLLNDQRKNSRWLTALKRCGSKEECKIAEDAVQKKSDDITKLQTRLSDMERQMKSLLVQQEQIKILIERKVSEAWKAGWAKFVERTDVLTREVESWSEGLKGWRDAPGFLSKHAKEYEALCEKVQPACAVVASSSIRRAVSDILYLKSVEKDGKDVVQPPREKKLKADEEVSPQAEAVPKLVPRRVKKRASSEEGSSSDTTEKSSSSSSSSTQRHTRPINGTSTRTVYRRSRSPKSLRARKARKAAKVTQFARLPNEVKREPEQRERRERPKSKTASNERRKSAGDRRKSQNRHESPRRARRVSRSRERR